MKTPMITRDADTFVALAQAVTLARAEGAVDARTSAELSAALVAGLLTGCMEMETYGKVHDALASLLERAFAGPTRPAEPSPPAGTGEDSSLEVYLEVVADAWDKVSWDDEAASRLKSFVRKAFDLSRARFGEDGWFRAPLRTEPDRFVSDARAAGLLVVSIEGSPPAGSAEGTLRDPGDRRVGSRVLLGWGERRVALDLGHAGGR